MAGAAGGRAPRAFGWALAVAEALVDGPREVAVVGPDGDPLRAALHAVALASPAPGAVVTGGAARRPRRPAPGRPPRDRRAAATAAFVCRGFVCELPTSDPGRWPAGCAEGARCSPSAMSIALHV